LDIDPDCPLSLTIDGLVLNNLRRRPDLAEGRYDAALDLNPNEGLGWLLEGTLHTFTGKAETAVEYVEKARLLSPLDPYGYFYDSLRASAHLANGNPERAVALAEASYQANKRHSSTLRVRIAGLHMLGRFDEAREAADEFKQDQPTFTVSDYLRSHPAADFAIGQQMANAMRASGIPD
jgi:tetratricopeptide (TPR) repeat protein